MASKIYTKEEVLLHNNENDCWIIINNRVYNITNYLTKHPGGNKILLQCAGKDCTEYFNNINHSQKAQKELENYYIGNILIPKSNKCNSYCCIM
jgi:cytochrome b involved in lipid metabolism